MSNQSNLQASIRSATSTTLDFNGDFMKEFANSSTGGVTYNEKLLAWINGELSTSYTNINEAMQAFAVSKSRNNWNAVTSI